MCHSGELPPISGVAIAAASEMLEPDIAAGIPDQDYDRVIDRMICALAAWRIAPWPHPLPPEAGKVAAAVGPDHLEALLASAPPLPG